VLYAKPWEHPSAVALLSIYTSVSSNQLLHPLQHNCFCRNLNRATWSGIICDFRMSFREFLDPVVNRFTRQTLPTVSRKYLFMYIPCIESFSYKKRTTERWSSVGYSSSMVTILTTETSLWTCACASATRLSWSSTTLLPIDVHRKHIMSITAVLLLFMIYLLESDEIVAVQHYNIVFF
jgi:hypothetical protein